MRTVKCFVFAMLAVLVACGDEEEAGVRSMYAATPEYSLPVLSLEEAVKEMAQYAYQNTGSLFLDDPFEFERDMIAPGFEEIHYEEVGGKMEVFLSYPYVRTDRGVVPTLLKVGTFKDVKTRENGSRYPIYRIWAVPVLCGGRGELTIFRASFSQKDGLKPIPGFTSHPTGGRMEEWVDELAPVCSAFEERYASLSS